MESEVLRNRPSKKVEFNVDSHNSKVNPEKDSQNSGDAIIVTTNSNWKCCSYQSMPKWLQLNEYIVEGYRPLLPSFSLCFKSIFRIHNESGNIWTHLVGCILFLGMTMKFMWTPMMGFDFQERLVFGIFFTGAIMCLGLSSIYHTVICHSENVKKNFGKLDYFGISLQIMGSFIPWLYYAFYCDTLIRNIYMTITILLGVSAMVASLWSKFGTRRFRPLRAAIFASFGLSAVFPAVHNILLKGMAYSFEKCSMGYLLLMAGLYLFGAALYAARIPEKLAPGKFDLAFHSHQIFHALVFFAALVHYYGISLLASNALREQKC